MKIKNNDSTNSFKTRYVVVGKSVSKDGSAEEIAKKAVQEASLVWDIVEKHCKKENIPFVVDGCHIHPSKAPLAEDIISYSFLTGDDALKFREHPFGGFLDPVQTFKLLKKNIIDASEALRAINKNIFDFKNGIIKNESNTNGLEIIA